MNETTKQIVDEINALYMRATDDFARLHDLALQGATAERRNEAQSALAIADLLFSAKHNCNSIRNLTSLAK